MDDYDDIYNSTFYPDHRDHDVHSSSLAGYDVHRLLAPAGGAPTVDYSVISILVMTLGIVLAVEVLRHQLDVAASGHPFFHTVLELMYRELTTLGIVEFCIYLMHKYHDNFNFEMEAMFVDVHFMLFYTAVFNALQSCLVRLLTGRLTDKVWVQTEDMDIRHYVALRREYDRLERMQGNNDNASSHSYSENIAESESSSVWKSFRVALRDLAFKIRHPKQSRRKYRLMLPIRFHALRAHFIDSYNLPPKFKVSHYLKRSLTSVLLDFVHISSASWIMLMVTANLLWFLSGMILYKSPPESYEVEEFLVFIFVAMMVIFVIAAFVLYFKMKSIFSNIMNMKLMIEGPEESREDSFHDGARLSRRKTKTLDQRKLFWGDNPHLIIVATQYMQFGYALGLAMIFTYFKDFEKMWHVIHPANLLLALLSSYLIFLKLLSEILPQYTLCTSIGQLANEERLNETLAKLQLTEEIHKKETLEEVRKAEEVIARRKEENKAKNAEAAARVNRSSKLLNLSIKDPKLVYRQPSSDPLDGPSSNSGLSSSEGRNGSAGMMSTSLARNGGASDDGQRRSWRRHSRKKSLSEGAQLMSISLFDGTSKSPDTSTLEQTKGSSGTMTAFKDRKGDKKGDASDDEQKETRPKPTRYKSLSDGDKFISNVGHHLGDLVRSGSTSPTGRLSAAASQELLIVDENEPQLDASLFKTDESSSSHIPLTQPMPPSRGILSTKPMNSTDPVAERHSEKPIPAPEESGAEAQHNLELSLNMVGTESVSELERPRRRSNSAEGAMMRHIDETDVTNGGRSGPPKSYAGLAEASLGRDGQKHRRRLMKTQSDGVSFMRSSPTLESEKEPDKLATLSELAKISTKDLPEVPDLSREVRPKRRPRTRAASEGVSSMRAGPTVSKASVDDTYVANTTERLKDVKGLSKMQHIDETDVTNGGHSGSSKLLSLGRDERKQRRRLMKTQSDGVSFMRSSPLTQRLSLESEKEPDKLATLSELAKISTKDLPEVPDVPQKVRPKRRPRTRAVSAGVSSMRAGPTVSETSVDDTYVANTTEGLRDVKDFSKMQHSDETDVTNGGHSGSSKLLSLGRDERKQRRRLMKTQSDGVSFMRSSLPKEPVKLSLKSIKERESGKLATLSELAQISTNDLPELTDPDFSIRVKRKARQRIRAASEGVSSMRAGRNDDMSSVAPINVSKDDTAMVNPGKELNVIPPKQEAVSATRMGLTRMGSARSKVTFSLGKSRDETSIEIRDDVSFHSTSSEDGDSDFDVYIAPASDDVYQSRLQTIKQNIDLPAFFEGSRYRIISLIFGPMACFFFVAMRVEIFNIFACTFYDQTNIWREMLAPCFWVQVSLYCLMIIEMISVLLVFLTKRGREGKLFACSAAIFGLLINVMCLLLLLIAEMKRCCPDKDDDIFMRLLAGPAPSKGDCNPDEYIECCPTFGERKYGGLGKIEPFTCLIALSPLRFLVAGYIVRFLGKGASHDEDERAHKETHGQHHGPDPTAKVRDLWMTAIGVHSDIAKLFGPFSSELLQCMLGIYSSETSGFAAPSSFPSSPSQLSFGDPESSDTNNESREHGSSLRRERENSMDLVSSASSKGITNPLEMSAINIHEYFEYPEAHLIRRMRRCEMRLLPLLNDEWIATDVIITRHELILFDIHDEPDVLDVASTKNKSGFKLTPLCDVAKGRAIMNQFNLDDVDFVDIEHRAATHGDNNDEDIENFSNFLEYWEGGNGLNFDYDADAMNKRWCRVDEDRLKIHFKDKQTLYLRFMVDLKEMEHKRKALEDDPDDLMNHVGTTTKLWCRCIANLRGAANLKQDLPHFGNTHTDEMEDFIEICDRDSESGHRDKHGRLDARNFRKNIHKRIGSFNLAGMDFPGTEN